MKNNRRSSVLIIIVVIVVLGVVYAFSVLTRKHEANDVTTPNLKETPVNREGNYK